MNHVLFSSIFRLKTPPLFTAIGDAFIAPDTWYNTDHCMDLRQEDIVTHIRSITSSHMFRSSSALNSFLFFKRLQPGTTYLITQN